MSRPPFDAWAIPGWMHAPSELPPVETASGSGVRRLQCSVSWVDALTRGLASRASDVWTAEVPGVGASTAGRVMTAAGRARALGVVGRRFADPGDPLRREAMAALPATSGLSPEMAEAVLDGMAADWAPERLHRLLAEEFGPRAVLDGFVSDGADRRVMAVPPALCVQIVAGSVPGVAATALIRSLLVGAPTLLKPGLGDTVLPVLFARGLREECPELADRLAVVYWPGADEAVLRAAIRHADLVVAYGSDRAVGAARGLAPPSARFVGYHHREGIGIVGSDALRSERDAARVAGEVARAVAFFDQRGCVSTRTLYVEDGGPGIQPRAFAALLAAALARVEDDLPSGRLEPMESSALHQFRGTAEMLASGLDPDTDGGAPGLWAGHGASWTVYYDPDAALETTCVGRVVVVRPFGEVTEVLDRVAPVGPHLQTVGVAGLGRRLQEIATALGRLGASRVAPFASVPFPPPWWHHDGRGPLGELVRWVDLEYGTGDGDDL